MNEKVQETFKEKPMSREEALLILQIKQDEGAEKLKPDEVMEVSIFHAVNVFVKRFETLFEKNTPEKGGSFYIRSKIYFAKKHLMMDFPKEFDVSKFNPGQEEMANQKQPEETQEEGSEANKDKK